MKLSLKVGLKYNHMLFDVGLLYNQYYIFVINQQPCNILSTTSIIKYTSIDTSSTAMGGELFSGITNGQESSHYWM